MSIAHTAYCPNFEGSRNKVWVDRRDVADEMIPAPKFPHSNGHGGMNPWAGVWDPRLTKIRRRINRKHPEWVKFYTNDQEMYESKLHFPFPLSDPSNGLEYTPKEMPLNPVWIQRRRIHGNEGLVGKYVDMQYNMWPHAQNQKEFEDYDPEDDVKPQRVFKAGPF